LGNLRLRKVESEVLQVEGVVGVASFEVEVVELNLVEREVTLNLFDRIGILVVALIEADEAKIDLEESIQLCSDAT